jgi:hypothetical protein
MDTRPHTTLQQTQGNNNNNSTEQGDDESHSAEGIQEQQNQGNQEQQLRGVHLGGAVAPHLSNLNGQGYAGETPATTFSNNMNAVAMPSMPMQQSLLGTTIVMKQDLQSPEAMLGPGAPIPGMLPHMSKDEDRKRGADDSDSVDPTKRMKTELVVVVKDEDKTDDGPAPVPPSKEGTSIFSDNDVLSGRGGGTNVHPGNRNFRDLINLHRRAYLKARKNDKPAISRAIVRTIRESTGRFLRKDEKTGLWFEIGDDAAREKTSQALRQRAPEMRKLLLDTEREEARVVAEEHLRQQRMMMGMGNNDMSGQGSMPPGMQNTGGMFPTPAFLAMAANKGNVNMQNMPQGQEYSQMFSAALLGGGINRFTSNGA